jgi:SAM-dependent methyltransferase
MKKQSPLLLIIKPLLMLHLFIGKVIDVLAIKSNGNLHPKHHLMQYYEFFINHIDTNDTILDIGCGNGFVASQVAKKASKVTGIDTDSANIRLAKKYHHSENIAYILGDATTYPFKEKYDVIILSNVLEHIEDRVPFLRKIQSLSDRILIRVPMLDRDWTPLYRKSLGMFYFCDSTHYTEYTEKSFAEEMTTSGLEVVESTIRFGEIWAVIKKNGNVSL